MISMREHLRQRTRIRILVAEDSVFHQKLAIALLHKAGYLVVVANNGREAVEALEIEDFDLVLMDVEMPVMNGLEATTVIRQREHKIGGHIPVVGVTSTAIPEECLAAGMDAHLSKPLRAETLHRTVQQVLR